MSSFKFQFESVLRYRNRRRDLCAQTLAHALAQDQEIAAKQQTVARQMQSQANELRGLGRQGTLDIHAARSRQTYLGQLTALSRQLQQQRDLVARQIELCRAAVTQAEQDVSIMEKLAEKQSAAFRYAQQRREIRDLDDSCRPVKAA